MELSNPKRVSLGELVQIAEAQGIQIPERTVGYMCPFEVGDIITCDGNNDAKINLSTMGKALLSEDGVTFEKGCYWVRDVAHEHGGAKLRSDLAASSFSRSGKKFDTLEATRMVRGKKEDNLAGFALYESVLNSLNLDAKTRQLNLDLSKPDGEIAKLKNLAGKTLRIIHTFTAFALKMNTKEEPDWGTKPGHWRQTKLLFFEEVVTTPKETSKSGSSKKGNK